MPTASFIVFGLLLLVIGVLSMIIARRKPAKTLHREAEAVADFREDEKIITKAKEALSEDPVDNARRILDKLPERFD